MSEDRVDPYALWLLRLTLAIALLALVGPHKENRP